MPAALACLPPGVVVGASRTGEIDKVDGPYYFFKLLQRARQVLPSWLPVVGVEGGVINIVPVDYVADAIDHIAHKPTSTARRSTSPTQSEDRRRGDRPLAHAADAPQRRCASTPA